MIHIAILLLFALILLKPVIEQKWHEFEWETPAKEAIAQSPGKRSLTPDLKESPTAPPASNLEPSLPSAPVNPTVKPIESPLIETPITQSNTDNATVVRINRNRNMTDALRGVADTNTTGGGNFGFSASLEDGGGEAYIIKQTIPKITPTMDDDVVVEFRLSESGSVIQNSINIVSYKQSAHVNALRAEMQNWRFGFKGAYNSTRVYRLRCKFSLR